MNRTLQVITLSFLCLSLSACANLRSMDSEIGMWQGGGKELAIYPGDPGHQQIWIDYIEAHNVRDLEKIASMNAPGWEGYSNHGIYLQGTEAQIAMLGEWFESDQNPQWEIRFMIANDTEEESWLTTGNDCTFIGPDGQQVREHFVHDVQIEDGKVKTVKVYARSAPDTPASRLDKKLRVLWTAGDAEKMLSVYEEGAIELFPQSFAGYVGHENIIQRYQAMFAEDSPLVGGRIESRLGGYTDLGDGFFIYDAHVETLTKDGEVVFDGLMSALGREQDGNPRMIQFVAHSMPPDDVNFLPPNPDQVDEVIASLPAIEVTDQALVEHLDRLRDGWYNHDVDALVDEFCEGARIITDGEDYAVRGLEDIHTHYTEFNDQIEEDSVFRAGGTLEYIVTGYHPINDRHVRAFGAWVVRNPEKEPIFLGGFGNVYRRDGDRLQILLNANSAVPFPTAEEWEEMQAAEAAAQEG